MAHTFPENIDEVDVISDAEVIVWNYIVMHAYLYCVILTQLCCF